MDHLVCMLIKMVMNCLVDGYLGLHACRIFIVVHGVDLSLWCTNIWCEGVEEIYTLCVLGFTNWDARCLFGVYICKRCHF